MILMLGLPEEADDELRVRRDISEDITDEFSLPQMSRDQAGIQIKGRSSLLKDETLKPMRYPLIEFSNDRVDHRFSKHRHAYTEAQSARYHLGRNEQSEGCG